MHVEVLRMTNVAIAGLCPGDMVYPYLTADTAAALARGELQRDNPKWITTLLVLNVVTRRHPHTGLPVIDVVCVVTNAAVTGVVKKLEFVMSPERPVGTAGERERDTTTGHFYSIYSTSHFYCHMVV